MQQRHVCPSGHRWEADRDATAPVFCPVCGEVAQDGPADAPTVGVAADAPPAPTLPALIGPYEVIEEVGRGGMGVVFKARDRDLDRVVALKMILSGEYAGEEARRRFQSEAVTVAHLHHPNVVAIHQVARAPDGTPYFVMEFCAGGTLAEKAGKPWPARDAAALVETLARAVAAAHEKNIVHRDLKPANILLDEHGAPKITDFGLARRLSDARQTASGAIMGTPAYMAPEQAGGKAAEVGPAADVWALGVILYELLAGQIPFRAASATDTLMRVLSDEPPPLRKLAPGVPRDLETICLKCLRKEPGKRYAGAADLADDLKRFLAGEPIHARPRRWWQRLSRRQRGWVTTAAIIAVTALLAGGLVIAAGTARHYRWKAYDQAWKRAAHHRDRKEYQQAIAAFDEAHRLRPKEADPLAHRAWMYHQTGDTDRALEDYAHALRLDERHSWARRSRGYVLLTLGRNEEAVADLSLAVEIDPSIAVTFLNRARAYMNLKRWADAEADLDSAIPLEKGTNNGYNLRAIARAAQGRYGDCTRDIENYAKRGPVSGGRTTTLFSHAAATLAAGEPANYRKARDSLLRLAEVEHEHLACILAARACLLPETTEVPVSRLQSLIDVGLKAWRKYTFYRRVQALLWLRTGQTEKALGEFEAVLKEDPKYSPGLVRLLIALALDKLGKKAEARRAFEQAQKDGIPTEHLHETLEYQVLLIEARKAVTGKDKPTP